MSFLNSITFRRRKKTSSECSALSNESSKLDESESASQIINCTASSLPNISIDNGQLTDLLSQVEKLRADLEIAHNEISSLNLENSKLNQRLQDSESKLKLYKKVKELAIPNKYLSPVQKSNKKRTMKQLTTSTQSSPLKKQFSPTIKDDITCAPTYSKGMGTTNETIPTKKSKVCILSSDRISHLNLMGNKLDDKYDYIQYRKPGVGMLMLLEGINQKLETFTENDFCLVFIGENDFLKSKNYPKLVNSIQERLSNLTHTNIIIVLPTYKIKHNVQLYNARVEAFNNLLYINMISTNSAYIFDSNLNLDYYNNYRRVNGNINDYEFKLLMGSLRDSMEAVLEYNAKIILKSSTGSDYSKVNDLFRI